MWGMIESQMDQIGALRPAQKNWMISRDSFGAIETKCDDHHNQEQKKQRKTNSPKNPQGPSNGGVNEPVWLAGVFWGGVLKIISHWMEGFSDS